MKYHLAFLLSLSLPLAGQAQIAFEQIARANDFPASTVPGTATAFQAFNHVATDGSNVVFWGSNTSQDEGIYAWNGTNVLRIADKNSTPDGKTISNFYQTPTVSRGVVAFGAFRSGTSPYAGIFTGTVQSDPAVANEVDTEDPVPGGLGDGFFLLEPQAIISGSSLRLKLTHYKPGGETFGSKHVGLFKSSVGSGSAGLDVILHPEVPDSGLSNNVITKMVSYDQGIAGLLLEDEFSEQKLVSHRYPNLVAGPNPGFLTTIAQPGDSPAALGGDSYDFFTAGPVISSGKAVFVASYASSSKQGIFLDDASPGSIGVLKIVDTDTVAPGTTGLFSGFGSVAFERRAAKVTNAGFTNYTYTSETVVFSAYVDAPVYADGLYMWQNGKLSKLLSKGDVFAGSSKVDSFGSTQFQLSPQSLVNGRLALEVENAVSTSNANLYQHGVYTAEIPPAPFPGGFPPSTVGFDSTNGVCFDFVGTVGDSYTVQYSDGLPAVWMTLTNFTYTAPVTICDPPPIPLTRVYRSTSP